MAFCVISYKIFNIWGGIFVSFNARYWDARGVENTVRCTRGFIKDAVNGVRKQRIGRPDLEQNAGVRSGRRGRVLSLYIM